MHAFWLITDVAAVLLAVSGIVLFILGIPTHIGVIRSRLHRMPVDLEPDPGVGLDEQTLRDITDAQKMVLSRNLMADHARVWESGLGSDSAHERLNAMVRSASPSLRRYPYSSVKSESGAQALAQCANQLSQWVESLEHSRTLRSSAHSLDATFFVTQMDSLKVIFDNQTGIECAMCLHVFVSEEEVVALFRDTRSNHLRRASDRRRNVRLNTDFSRIVHGGIPYFVANDLDGIGDYQNENPQWSEEYMATITVPVQHMSDKMKTCLGFLSIDAPCKNAFDLVRESCMLTIAADALSPFLVEYFGLVDPRREAVKLAVA